MFLSRSSPALAFVSLLSVLAIPGGLAIPAFPGAEGFGANAAGGRGGDVYVVTNLNSTGAGSLYNGLTTIPTAGRTIVFAVSGQIHLAGGIATRITGSKLTIAGQTAPGDGILLKDGTLRISGDDIVIRHLRFRHGKNGSGGDCIDLDSGCQNAILDHISMSFSTDENISSFGSPPENLTMQWSLNAWGLESHSCGGLWDQNHATCHHSLWAHNHTRNPKARPNNLLEWTNNITFDWDIGFIMGDSQTPAGWKANVRSNYFICPPGNIRNTPLEKASLDRNGYPNFSVYQDNNLHDRDGDGILNGTDRGWSIVSGSAYDAATNPTGNYIRLAAPVAGSTALTIDPPLLAYKKVVSNGGALRTDIAYSGTLRDEVDTRLFQNVTTQTRNHITRESDLAGVSNGGFGTFAASTPPVDTDKDGMPDFYETALGWSAAAQDHNTALANSAGLLTGTTFFPSGTVAGYTRLEEYLHFMAIPHATVPKNLSGTPTSFTVDLRRFTAGFAASPSFAVSAVSNGTVAQYLADGTTPSATGPIAKFTPTLNYVGRARFDFTVTDAAGSSWTQTLAVLVSQSGLPRDLNWKGDGASNLWDSATNNWLRGGTATAFSFGDRVSFDDSGSRTPALSVSSTVSPSSVDVNATGNYTFSGSGAISASGALTKRGPGTLTLNNTGANAFTDVSLDEGTLSLNGFSTAGTGKISLNGGSLVLSTAIGNPLEFNSPTTITVGSQQTMSGNWTGSEAVTVNGTTSHLWTLSGTWTGYTGRINLGTGNVRIRLNGGSSNSMYGSPSVAVNLGSGTSQLMNRNGHATIPFELGSLESTGSGTVLSGTQTGTINSTYSVGGLNTSTTFAGSIVNGGGVTNLVKVGSGDWTLSGNSTYTGTTTASAGGLIVAGSLGNTAVTVNSGALLAGSGTIGGAVTCSTGSFISPGTLPFTGATMTLNGGLTLNGNTLYYDMSNSPTGANDRISMGGGSLTLTGTPFFQFLLLQNTLAAGTYDLISGASSISASGIQLAHNLPTGTRQTFDLAVVGTTVRLTVTGDPATLTWTGATSAVWDSTTTGNWTGATPATFGSNDAVVFNDTSSVTNISVPSPVTPRSTLFNNSTRAFTLAGGLNGGSLTKSGTNSLSLTGANTFGGGLVLNAGTLILANDTANANGLGTGTVTLNAGTLSMFDNVNSYNSFTAALVVPAGATARINADSRVDVYGTLSGGGTLNFYVPYVRTTLFSDWSAFTGTINVITDSSGGDFRTGTNYAYPGFPNALVSLSDKVWSYYDGILSQGAGTTIPIGALAGTSQSVLQGGPTGGRALTYRIGGRNTDATFAGSISERNTSTATNYVKTGTGTWTLSGSGSWNGGTTVEQGTLKLSGPFSCAGATSVQPGATLQLAGGSLATDAVNVAAGATLTGSGTVTGDLNNDGTVTAMSGGTLTVTGDVVNNGTMRVASGTALVATGSFVNNGILDLLTASAGLPPNLENNGIVIDSSSLRTTSVAKSGNVVTIKVPTHSAHNYQLQRSTSLTGVWSDVGTAQAGLTTSGGLPTERTFVDNAATFAKCFYRVKVTP